MPRLPGPRAGEPAPLVIHPSSLLPSFPLEMYSDSSPALLYGLAPATSLSGPQFPQLSNQEASPCWPYSWMVTRLKGDSAWKLFARSDRCALRESGSLSRGVGSIPGAPPSNWRSNPP